MQSRRPSEATMSEALSVALQHPAVATRVRMLCRMLQVCKAWRRAVKQSNACLTDIKFSKQIAAGTGEPIPDAAGIAAGLGSLAHWVSSYAGTVRSIIIDVKGLERPQATVVSLKRLAQQVLALGLKSAWAPYPTIALSGNSTVDAAGTILSPPLQLRSVSLCSEMASTLIVSALPAATLTRLRVTVTSTDPLHAAISSLSNLRRLELDSSSDTCLLDSYVSSTSSLVRLTHLAAGPLRETGSLTFLPQQLSILGIQVMGNGEEPQQVDLSRLTELQQLRAIFGCTISAAVVPQQLRDAQIACRGPVVSAFNLSSLSQLQTLTLSTSRDTPADLLTLQELQQLTAVELGYASGRTAAAAASAWPQLQQLAGLRLKFACSTAQMTTVFAALTGLTSLQKLHMECKWVQEADLVDAEAVAHGVASMRRVCESLKHLVSLTDLTLDLSHWVSLQKGDVLHLSSLTGLTRLWLRPGHVLPHTTAIVLFLELTRLQELSLWNVQDIGVLPVIGKLQELTLLSISGLPQEVQQQGLRHLTQLRNLRSIAGFKSCGKEAIRQFWCDLRGWQRRQ